MAAEIVSRDRIRRMWMDRFNEAAANGRGNLVRRVVGLL